MDCQIERYIPECDLCGTKMPEGYYCLDLELNEQDLHLFCCKDHAVKFLMEHVNEKVAKNIILDISGDYMTRLFRNDPRVPDRLVKLTHLDGFEVYMTDRQFLLACEFTRKELKRNYSYAELICEAYGEQMDICEEEE